jgi:hypothetical protein
MKIILKYRIEELCFFAPGIDIIEGKFMEAAETYREALRSV